MLIVYSGSMASGKSKKLLREIRLAEKNNEKHLVLHCTIGFRGDSVIHSRGGDFVPAKGIETIRDILLELKANKDVQKVFVDEVQFFELNIDDIKELTDYCTLCKIKLYMSGLELDCFNNPFKIMGALFCYADRVLKYKGICDVCGKHNSSRRALRYINGLLDEDESNVLVIDNDANRVKYTPVCHECYINRHC